MTTPAGAACEGGLDAAAVAAAEEEDVDAAMASAHALRRDEGGKPRGPPPGPFAEDVEEKFELAHASTELMSHQAAAEEEVFAILLGPRGSKQRLSPSVRRLALDVVAELVKSWSSPEAACFQGATLLDVWISAHPAITNRIFLGEMPAVCLAVVRTLHKAVERSLGSEDDMWWSPGEEEVDLLMLRLGYKLPAGWQRSLHAQERSLLRCTGWRINVPTIESWLSALEARFDVLSGGLFAEQVTWARAWTLPSARGLVRWRPAGAMPRPLRLAVGLFGLGLVHARLLSLEALRPQHVDWDEWEQLFLESQGVGGVPASTPQPYLWAVSQSLAGAAHVPLEEVQQACELTMGCLRGARGAAQRELGSTAPP